ncbi:unnamed protein product [Somion occarium]|uniref:RRM domain-containing protein n=1 Tax=Somion occarium TaxID=3059160 RepID=A0ABP1CXS0_9APHY
MAASRNDRKPYSRPAPRPRGSEGEWLHDKAPGARSGTSNGVSQARSNSAPSAKLIISNLHYEVTEKDVAAIFGTKVHLRETDHPTSIRFVVLLFFKYDRSGRSSGVAIVSYETLAEAAAAKREYDGRLCKNQPMSIDFYNPAPKRAVSAPSLLNRIQKPPLLDRLGQDQKHARDKGAPQSGAGPIRSRPRHSTGRAPRAPKAPKKPMSAEDLDKEIDTFMKDDNAIASAPTATNGNGTAQVVQDVEMA